MNYFNVIKDALSRLISNGMNKFAIYPYGEKGAMAKGILSEIFSINDVIIFDNKLSSEFDNIYRISEIENNIDGDTILLIASDNESVYKEIRKELYKYIDEERCYELLPAPESIRREKQIIAAIKKNIDEKINIFLPKKTKSRFFLPMQMTDLIQNNIYLNEDYFESYLIKYVFEFHQGVIRKRIENGEGIIDIGANIGNHTLYYCNEVMAKVVYAFEPILPTFMILMQNIKINELEDKVKLFNCALGERRGCGKVNSYDINNIGGAHVEVGSGEIEIECLDNIEINDPIGFVKIDVEGMEVEVLKGGKNFFCSRHPYIQIESFSDKYDEMNEILHQYGYKCVAKLCDDNYLFF